MLAYRLYDGVYFCVVVNVDADGSEIVSSPCKLAILVETNFLVGGWSITYLHSSPLQYVLLHIIIVQNCRAKRVQWCCYSIRHLSDKIKWADIVPVIIPSTYLQGTLLRSSTCMYSLNSFYRCCWLESDVYFWQFSYGSLVVGSCGDKLFKLQVPY